MISVYTNEERLVAKHFDDQRIASSPAAVSFGTHPTHSHAIHSYKDHVGFSGERTVVPGLPIVPLGGEVKR